MDYFQSKIAYIVNNSYPFAISPTKINFEIYKDVSLQKDLFKYQSKIPLNSYFSPQELCCVSYLAKGKTAKEVARLMKLSPRTIEHYIDNIRRKTGYRRKVEIVKFFEDTGNIKS